MAQRLSIIGGISVNSAVLEPKCGCGWEKGLVKGQEKNGPVEFNEVPMPREVKPQSGEERPPLDEVVGSRCVSRRAGEADY